MAQTIAEGKEVHSISFEPLIYDDLLAFRDQNKIQTTDIAIAVLLETYRGLLDAHNRAKNEFAAAEGKIEEANEYLREIKEQEHQLDLREIGIKIKEEQLRNGASLSDRAIAVLREAVDAGMDKNDVIALAGIVARSDLPVADFIDHLTKLGGYVNYIRTLGEAIRELEIKKVDLEDKNAAVGLVLVGARKELEKIRQDKIRMNQELEEAIAFTKSVTAAYASLGIVFDNIVSRVLSGGLSITDLPEIGIRLLAGTILTIGTKLYGDCALTVPVNIEANRLINTRIMLSEVPNMLAPRELYDELKRRLTRQDEMAGAVLTQPEQERGLITDEQFNTIPAGAD